MLVWFGVVLLLIKNCATVLMEARLLQYYSAVTVRINWSTKYLNDVHEKAQIWRSNLSSKQLVPVHGAVSSTGSVFSVTK